MKSLQTLKVLDFSPLLPGPYATMLLADMGADVLRVESPTRPDLVKFLEPQVDGGRRSTLHRPKTSFKIMQLRRFQILLTKIFRLGH